MSRQKFLTGATVGLGALMGAIIAVPSRSTSWRRPSGTSTNSRSTSARRRSTRPPSQGEIPYHEVTLENLPNDDSGLSRRLVFIRNDGDDKFTAVSNTCMHLGCPVQPSTTGFACPCHGGQYDREGRRTAGPPVRPLNRYRRRSSDTAT